MRQNITECAKHSVKQEKRRTVEKSGGIRRNASKCDEMSRCSQLKKREVEIRCRLETCGRFREFGPRLRCGDTRSFTPREQLCGLPRLHSRNPNGTARVSLDFTRRQARDIATKKFNYNSRQGWSAPMSRDIPTRKKSRIYSALLSSLLFALVTHCSKGCPSFLGRIIEAARRVSPLNQPNRINLDH